LSWRRDRCLATFGSLNIDVERVLIDLLSFLIYINKLKIKTEKYDIIFVVPIKKVFLTIIKIRIIDSCIKMIAQIFSISTFLCRQQRDNIVVATKVRFTMGQEPNSVGLSRRHIIKSCEDSLERLQTDYIDLLQVNENKFLDNELNRLLFHFPNY
jgi:hypothetical protein